MKRQYHQWLKNQDYADNTQVAQLHRVRKVEETYGDLDDLIRDGKFDAMIVDLTYSTADERRKRDNPSRLNFQGNIRNNLQSYKNAALRYARFALGDDDEPVGRKDRTSATQVEGAAATQVPEKQRLSLERDMQAALRRDVSALESGLVIIDEGDERGVHSGFIDILCEDASGALVVIELKAGRADARVFSQTLGYMGDLMAEEDGRTVRGIIVAHGFDKRATSAARAVPNINVVTYEIAFEFRSLEAGS